MRCFNINNNENCEGCIKMSYLNHSLDSIALTVSPLNWNLFDRENAHNL